MDKRHNSMWHELTDQGFMLSLEVGLLTALAYHGVSRIESAGMVLYALILMALLVYVRYRTVRTSHIKTIDRFRLDFLAGPCLLLSITLLVNVHSELTLLEMVGGLPKEWLHRATQPSISEVHHDQGFSFEVEVEKRRSERPVYVILAISTSLLYVNHWAKAREYVSTSRPVKPPLVDEYEFDRDLI